MRYPKTTFSVGATRPFEALQIGDTHLLFADGRDNKNKYDIAMRRYGEYEYTNVGRNVPYFLDALLYAQQNHLLLLHVGDLIDFVSLQNLEVAQKLLALAGVDYLMCAGNHEYTHYSGQYPTTPEEEAEGRKLVPGYFKNDLFFTSRVINGVNFLAVDNGDYQFFPEQVKLLRAEIGKRLPIVLLIHNPIFTPGLLADGLGDEESKERTHIMVDPPEAMLRKKDPKFMSHLANAATREFLDTLYASGLLKVVLAGHIHLHGNSESALPCGARQLVVGGGYYGCGAHLRFE